MKAASFPFWWWSSLKLFFYSVFFFSKPCSYENDLGDRNKKSDCFEVNKLKLGIGTGAGRALKLLQQASRYSNNPFSASFFSWWGYDVVPLSGGVCLT